MILFGQLLDTVSDNELLIVRSSHERSLVYIDELRAHDVRQLITKDARTCPVADIYSDNSERQKGETVTVIYIKPNGYLILLD